MCILLTLPNPPLPQPLQNPPNKPTKPPKILNNNLPIHNPLKQSPQSPLINQVRIIDPNSLLNNGTHIKIGFVLGGVHADTGTCDVEV